MREKMRAHLDTGGENKGFDLKQGAGGLIDIEFMVQYLVLAWSRQHPDLMVYSDNVRQLEAAAKLQLIKAEEAQTLIEIYTYYRSRIHRLTLQQQGRVAQGGDLAQYQEKINGLWQRFLQNSIN